MQHIIYNYLAHERVVHQNGLELISRMEPKILNEIFSADFCLLEKGYFATEGQNYA